jgi:hypothetical protein
VVRKFPDYIAVGDGVAGDYSSGRRKYAYGTTFVLDISANERMTIAAAPIRNWTASQFAFGETNMLRTVLIVFLILLLLGALPTWGYSGGWGYYPSGGLGLVLLVVIILVLVGKI